MDGINLDKDEIEAVIEILPDINSNRDFFKLIHKQMPVFNKYNKGIIWGQKLMEFASEHREFTTGDLIGEERPIIKAVYTVLTTATFSDFLLSRAQTKVDPESVEPTPRN